MSGAFRPPGSSVALEPAQPSRARRPAWCEGHGDLRCEHVSLAGDSMTIIDCVEFSEGLRYVDVASDVGFLAMDLDRLGARGLSDDRVGGRIARPPATPIFRC